MSDFIKGKVKSNFKREQIKKRNAHSERGERALRVARPSLRDDIARLDQELLRLLLKRYNLICKIRQNGRMSPADEKFLREKWQASVARVSKDADLSSRFFTLLQEISFLPRPENIADQQSGDTHRSAFTFNPPKGALNFSLDVPAETMSACSWFYMAVASGQAFRLDAAPDNSPARDCINAFIQMGADLTRDKCLVDIKPGKPISQPDRVLYAGASKFNFFLFLAHYLGKASRVKITGEKSLNLADFTDLRHFLPTLGARMVHVVPKSSSLPVRLECSGLLPAGIEAIPELPPEFYAALLLASPFYERPFSIDFNKYGQKEKIFSRVLPILEQCAVIFTLDGASIVINPSAVKLPEHPQIPMDPLLAGFLLLFPEAAGGKADLRGFWPDWPECLWLEKCLQVAGGKFTVSREGLVLERDKGMDALNMEAFSAIVKNSNKWEKGLLISLAVCAFLHKAELGLPPELLDEPACQDFLRACGLRQEDGGNLYSYALEGSKTSIIWNAPGALWALALAVCATARNDKNPCQLGNPGIISEIWIPFWSWYNSLLRGEKWEEQDQAPNTAAKSRRRIRTSAEAILPELKEDELD